MALYKILYLSYLSQLALSKHCEDIPERAPVQCPTKSLSFWVDVQRQQGIKFFLTESAFTWAECNTSKDLELDLSGL